MADGGLGLGVAEAAAAALDERQASFSAPAALHLAGDEQVKEPTASISDDAMAAEAGRQHGQAPCEQQQDGQQQDEQAPVSALAAPSEAAPFVEPPALRLPASCEMLARVQADHWLPLALDLGLLLEAAAAASAPAPRPSPGAGGGISGGGGDGAGRPPSSRAGMALVNPSPPADLVAATLERALLLLASQNCLSAAACVMRSAARHKGVRLVATAAARRKGGRPPVKKRGAPRHPGKTLQKLSFV